MCRKVYVDVSVRLIVECDEGLSIEEILSDMDYNFKSNTDGGEVVDYTIKDWDITDSK